MNLLPPFGVSLRGLFKHRVQCLGRLWLHLPAPSLGGRDRQRAAQQQDPEQ